MAHYRVSKKVRRRKVADLAAKSRIFSVNNCTIQHIDGNTETVKDENGKEYIVGKIHKWKKERHIQPKPLRKACWKEYFKKEDHDHLPIPVWERHVERMKSEFPQIPSTKLTRAELIEGLIREKIKKWERKHPCPAKDDDLFKEEFIPKWKKEREEALEHFRDFVVSVYHKLKIVGVCWVDHESTDKIIAEIKDENMKGHRVKHPYLQVTDNLYKKAVNAASDAMIKDCTIKSADLLNHEETERRSLYDAPMPKQYSPKIYATYHKFHPQIIKQAA